MTVAAPCDHAGGKALLELALILPLLLTVIFGSAELYRNYQIHQVLSVVGREIGNAAFRSCTDYANAGQTSACLQELVNSVFSRAVAASDVTADSRVFVKVFRYDNAAAAALAGQYQYGPNAPWANSSFTPDSVARLKCYLPENVNIVTTEVFLHVEPYAPFFSGNYREVVIF